MLEVLRSPDANRTDAPLGSWWRMTTMDGRMPPVSIKCPLCGRASTLNHTIHSDGVVTPSVVCPHKGCTWHEFVKLVGYAP